MRTRNAVILFALAFLLRPLLQVLLPGWLTLDVSLCLLIAISMTMTRDEMVGPLIAAFVFEGINDLCFTQHVGVTPIAMVVMVTFILLIRMRFDVENAIIDLLIIFISFVLYHSTYWLIYWLLGAPYSYFYMAERLTYLLPVEVAITGIILYFMVRVKIQKRRDSYFK